MMRALAAAGLIAVASGLTGCVAASRYSELEAQRDILQTEQERLTRDIAKLQEDLGQLPAVEPVQEPAVQAGAHGRHRPRRRL